jgi:hypothetical protein
MRRTIIALLLLTGAVGLFGQTADKEKVVRGQQELTWEYELAKEPHFYFILDAPHKNLELRVRGMVLRTWKIESVRFWGKPAFTKTVRLIRKSALKPPQRNVIKPGETATVPKDPKEAAAFELDALELKDMPRSFSLDFDNGLHVSVKSKETGLPGVKEEIYWYGSLPLRNFVGGGKGKAISEMQIRFQNEKDAQAIYWIFVEGIKGLIY